jgi:hypothetical protein
MERLPSVEVELDVFSGRPNPRWMMRTDLAQDLASVTGQPQVVAPNEPPGLGYRGFTIHNLSGNPQLPATLHVYDGTIAVPTGDDRHLYFADEQGLERQLMADAIALGYGDLIRAFGGSPEAQGRESTSR